MSLAYLARLTVIVTTACASCPQTRCAASTVLELKVKDAQGQTLISEAMATPVSGGGSFSLRDGALTYSFGMPLPDGHTPLRVVADVTAPGYVATQLDVILENHPCGGYRPRSFEVLLQRNSAAALTEVAAPKLCGE